ncbi:hypothetical protein ABMX65_23550, partial [Vibrio vulnificus]
DRQIAAIDQNCRSRSRWCRGFYEKLIARSRYLNSGISCGMTVPDIYSLALEIQRIASISFRVSARLGRLVQSEI